MSMRASYVSKLAIRNIWGHKLRSILTILGIIIGVGFIVFLVSIGYGLQRISTNNIANLQALQIIDVTPGKSHVIKINDDALDKFSHLSKVQTVAPEVDFVGNVSYDTSSAQGVIYGKNLNYLDLEDEQLSSGKFYTSDQEKEALIDTSMLGQLNLKEKDAIGKQIKVQMVIQPDSMANPTDQPLTVEQNYSIVGVLKTESSPYIYIPLEQFRMIGVGNYTSAKVKVADKETVATVQTELENMGYKTSTLKQTVDQINQFFQVFQLILLSFGIIAVIVASIGMFNTLTISLLEKTREISFMKVMGTTKGDIWKLFLAEAMIIGLVGTALGLAGGILLGNSLNAFLVNLAHQTGNKPVEVFYTPPIAVLIIFASAIIVSVVTGVYPSARASGIDPLESMRYE